MSSELYKELSGWKIPVESSPARNDKLFLERVAPVIKEYQENPITSKSINKVWRGFWGMLGDINGFKYRVPRCPPLTREEIESFEKKDKMVLLLPPEISTPEGLKGLSKVFPLSMSWTDDPKEVLKISNNSKGGCFITKMKSSAPYTTQSEYESREKILKPLGDILHSVFSEEQVKKIINKVGEIPYITPPGGYSKDQLEEKVKSDGELGMGISTFMVASKFFQLISGEPFDVRTFSRIPGSLYGEEALAITSKPDGCFSVLKCPSDRSYPILGIRSVAIISEKNHIWQRFTGGKVA